MDVQKTKSAGPQCAKMELVSLRRVDKASGRCQSPHGLLTVKAENVKG